MTSLKYICIFNITFKLLIMAIISLPGSAEFWLLAIILVYWGLIIQTVVSIFRRADLELVPRLLWTVIILIAPLIGIFLYNFFGHQPKKV